MAIVRVDLHVAEFNKLRNEPGVVAMLREKAKKVEAAAGAGHDVQVHVGGARARATVMTKSISAKKREAQNRNLLRALGAAR